MLDLGTLSIGIKVNDAQAKQGLSNLGNEIDNTGKRTNKLIGIAKKLAGAYVVKKAIDGIVGIGKAAFSAYASYEQLAGGVEKLFGDASDIIMKNAQNAYKTAGMSANQYMTQATSFSASLIASCSGNTVKAAKVADMAMRDMADNVNVFGSNMEDVQRAYQGFAKQNYTMLDNLKLGYGGTKTEMERLLADAGKLTGKKYDINNLQDVYEAIHAIQVEQKITGTTAKEASKTVEGSIASMKASWQNWLTALGSGEGVEQRTQELMNSIGTVIKNAAPVIAEIAKSIFTGVADAIGEELDAASEKVSAFVEKHKALFTTAAVVLGTLAVALVAYNAAAIAAAVASGAQTVALTAMIAAETVATAATTALGVAFNFLTAPITLIILGIAALVAGIILLVKNWDKVRAAFAKGLDLVINSEPIQKAKEFIENLKKAWEDFKKKVKKVTFKIGSAAIDKAKAAIEKLHTVWTKMKSGAAKAASFAAKYNSISLAITAIKKVIDLWNKIRNLKATKTFTVSIKASLAGLSKKVKKILGLRRGTREIPYDGYEAELHKGERVLTASENNQYERMMNGTNNTATNSQIAALVNALQNGSLTVVTQIDGRTVAQTTAPFVSTEINKINSRNNRLKGVYV